MKPSARNQRRSSRTNRGLLLASGLALLLALLVASAPPRGARADDSSPVSGAATVQFSDTNFNVTEGCVPAQLTVTLSDTGISADSVTVDYTVSDGTASQKSDYTFVAGTADVVSGDVPAASKTKSRLTFAAGETSKTITILVNDDGYAEGPETVNVTLSNPRGAALGTLSTATLTINDDDTVDSATNPIDDPQDFVCQHYHDFLHRQPDDAGLKFWTDQLKQCGTDADCMEEMRVNVSAAFFVSIEYQQTSYFIHRLYAACLGRRPQYAEFMRDLNAVGEGVVVGADGWQDKLEQNKQAFATEFAQRSEFADKYKDVTSADQFVDEMFEYADVTPTDAEHQQAAALYGAGDAAGRATAMRFIVDRPAVFNKYYNSAFVLAEYMGYLRRDPDGLPDADMAGFNYWLSKLDSFSPDGEDVTNEGAAVSRVKRAEMIRAFINSSEYRGRFGR
jgi:hypothetical protein